MGEVNYAIRGNNPYGRPHFPAMATVKNVKIEGHTEKPDRRKRLVVSRLSKNKHKTLFPVHDHHRHPEHPVLLHGFHT